MMINGAYLKEWLMICVGEDADGRARVTQLIPLSLIIIIIIILSFI